MAALSTVWAVMDAAAGERWARSCRRSWAGCGSSASWALDDAAATKLCAMSARTTIDRRLAGERQRLMPKGRSGTKPGSLLEAKDQDPDLGSMGRTVARFRGDRPSRPRGR